LSLKRKTKLKFLLRLHKKDSHLLEILWWQTNERDFKHRKHYLGDCYIKKQVCNFFFKQKVFWTLFSLLFLPLPHHLYHHHFSPQMPLYSSLCRYRINKKKCLYLREPLFQFLGLCTIVENQKKVIFTHLLLVLIKNMIGVSYQKIFLIELS